MSLTPKAILFSFLLLILGFGRAYTQVRLSPEEADKLVAEKTEPAYPPIAKALKLQDTVKVDITVSEAGSVISTEVISGHPMLRQAALEAAKSRKYKPYEVNGKPTPFVTTVDVIFSLGLTKEEYEREQGISKEFFKAEEKCRNLAKGQKWKEAETACRVAARFADQFSSGRELEKSGAYQYLGYTMMGQKRYQEALEYYSRALDFVRPKLTEKNAELGQLYGDLAVAHHALGNLEKARELYRVAERIYQIAHAELGGGDTDEETKAVKQSYIKALKKLLELHLIAAQGAGATSEVEEIKKLMNSLPRD